MGRGKGEGGTSDCRERVPGEGGGREEDVETPCGGTRKSNGGDIWGPERARAGFRGRCRSPWLGNGCIRGLDELRTCPA